MSRKKQKAGVTGEDDNVNCKVITQLTLSKVNLHEYRASLELLEFPCIKIKILLTDYNVAYCI